MEGVAVSCSIPITLDTFLSAAFAPIQPNEKGALGLAYPGNRGFKPVRWERGTSTPPLGLHFNCATFKPEAARARLDVLMRVYVVMFDDIGNLEGKSQAPIDRVLSLPEETRHTASSPRVASARTSMRRRAGSSSLSLTGGAGLHSRRRDCGLG